MSEQPEAPRETQPGHETQDISLSGVARVTLALIVALVVIHLLLIAMYHDFDRRRSLAGRDTPPIESGIETAPRLETDPDADLRALRAREEDILRTYGWIDRGRGVVRVPIERAMEWVAKPGNTP